jgi:hypothetical protein
LQNTVWTNRGPLCIRRKFSNEVYQPPEALGEFIRTRDKFQDFAYYMEIWHMTIHSSINGEMITPYSPNDPIFFIMHAFMDKLFFDWQNHDPANRMYQFDSVSPYNGGNTVNANSELPGYPGVKVSDVLNTLDLCYVYVNPNTAFTNAQDVLQNGYTRPSYYGNGTSNVTIPKPSEVSPEVARRLGWSQSDVEKANQAMQTNVQEVQKKIDNNEKVYGPGVNASNFNSNHQTGPYPFDVNFFIDQSGKISQNLLQLIMPRFKSSGGYTYGEGTYKSSSDGKSSSGSSFRPEFWLFIIVFSSITALRY